MPGGVGFNSTKWPLCPPRSSEHQGGAHLSPEERLPVCQVSAWTSNNLVLVKTWGWHLCNRNLSKNQVNKIHKGLLWLKDLWKHFNRHFSKDADVACRQVATCSCPFFSVNKKMKIRTMMRYHCTPARVADKKKNSDTSTHYWGYGETRTITCSSIEVLLDLSSLILRYLPEK